MCAGIRNSTFQIVQKAGHFAAFEQPEEVAMAAKALSGASGQVRKEAGIRSDLVCRCLVSTAYDGIVREAA